ncbi:MAG: tRNA uridine-5-carboxymethylaminomethyl(34) synthesis GTPase MnmE, partial [Pseudorhodoplanes sp.]
HEGVGSDERGRDGDVAADARPDERDAEVLTDTIFALSSGAPPAGIAVVRISGPGAAAALACLAGRPPEPRRATLRTLRRDGKTLDRALILFFPGPESATGEDVAELHLHGGRAIVASVRAALGGMGGLREAAPGEFTRRAFENGRIDLAEAEGLADLIAAETEAQRRAALDLAGGALSRQTEVWRTRLLAIAARVEAALDFSDEADVGDPAAGIASEVTRFAQEIAGWLDRPPAERLKDGIRVVLAGPPNAGKSSLFNALIGREAAIVAAAPGTTRDLVEAPVAIGGVAFLLVDTAGLREAVDQVETIGIERARASAETADIVLWLGIAADKPDDAIAVHTKADLFPAPPEADLAVSSFTGQGLSDLGQMLVRRSEHLLVPTGEIALNERHRRCLASMLSSLREAEKATDPLILAETLRRARLELDRLTGRAGVEDLLSALFGRFCIGK